MAEITIDLARTAQKLPWKPENLEEKMQARARKFGGPERWELVEEVVSLRQGYLPWEHALLRVCHSPPPPLPQPLR